MEQLKSILYKAVNDSLAQGPGVNLSTLAILTIVSLLSCLAPTLFLRLLHFYGLHLQTLPTAENPDPPDVSRRIQAILLSTSMGAALPQLYTQILDEVSNPDKEKSISVSKAAQKTEPAGLFGSLSAIFTRPESFRSAAVILATVVMIGGIQWFLSLFVGKEHKTPIQLAMQGLEKAHYKGIMAAESLETQEERGPESARTTKVTTSQLRNALATIRKLYLRLAHMSKVAMDASQSTLEKYAHVISMLLTHVISNIGQGIAAARNNPKDLLKSFNATLTHQALEGATVGFGLTLAGPRFQPLVSKEALVDSAPIDFHLSFLEQMGFSCIYALSLPLGAWIAKTICPERPDNSPESISSTIDQYLTKIICGSSLHKFAELFLLLISEPQRGMECATMVVMVSYFANKEEFQTFKTIQSHSRRAIHAENATVY